MPASYVDPDFEPHDFDDPTEPDMIVSPEDPVSPQNFADIDPHDVHPDVHPSELEEPVSPQDFAYIDPDHPLNQPLESPDPRDEYPASEPDTVGVYPEENGLTAWLRYMQTKHSNTTILERLKSMLN